MLRRLHDLSPVLVPFQVPDIPCLIWHFSFSPMTSAFWRFIPLIKLNQRSQLLQCPWLHRFIGREAHLYFRWVVASCWFLGAENTDHLSESKEGQLWLELSILVPSLAVKGRRHPSTQFCESLPSVLSYYHSFFSHGDSLSKVPPRNKNLVCH